jgi:hypothetical protein
MVAIEQIEQKLLALPLKHRVFLAESLLASVPPAAQEMTEAEEMAEVERREEEIETAQVRALTDAEFWREVEADLNQCG